MGGLNSGRRRSCNIGAVDQTCSLDIRQLRQRGVVRAGWIVRTVWSWRRGDADCGSVSLAACLADTHDAILTISYRVGELARTERVRLEAVPCRYGGHRFYFRCPASDRRCEVLALVNGRFACRQHHRLTYVSQSETPLDRLGRRARRAEARVLGKDGCRRPRGANRQRLLSEWIEWSSAWDDAVEAEGLRRFGAFAI